MLIAHHNVDLGYIRNDMLTAHNNVDLGYIRDDMQTAHHNVNNVTSPAVEFAIHLAKCKLVLFSMRF